ncbi:hypothetical protein ACFFRI_05220, partial [Nocardioides plantarum]
MSAPVSAPVSTPVSAPTSAHAPDEVLLAFARALRAAGVGVTHDRAAGFLEATALVGLGARGATYAAGRATLCSTPDDLLRYDQVFEAFFDARDGLPREKPAAPSRPVTSSIALGEGAGEGDADEQDDAVRALASEVEVLRHRDLATMTAAE